MKQMILPVFYHVDPTHVQELESSYGDALVKHKKDPNYNSNKLDSWMNALRTVGNLSGCVSRNIKPDAKLIEQIMNHTLKKLNDRVIPSDSYDDGLVGINKRVKDVEELLCLELVDVQCIGIWGMGGIGKTTIASKLFKQIYNQFQDKCFIANVIEKLEKYTSFNRKLEVLYNALNDGGLNIGMPSVLSSVIMRKLSRRKVLIVLDDVSDMDLEPIESLIGKHAIFGPGSRIIVTSRDKQLLKNLDAKIYEVKKLKDDGALKLFSFHAFKQNFVKKEFMALSSKAIGYAGGNPLALKVLGSNLFRKSMEEWEDELEKLKDIPDRKIQKILRISYDGLDQNEKEIFLDIACFFKLWDKNRAISILEGCGFHAKCGISGLIDKSLISISGNNTLQMHDLVQQMGKDIVGEEKEIGKRSRLYNSKDLYKLLNKDMRTKRVESILANMSQIGYIELSSTAFVKMSNLRLLKLYSNGQIKLVLPEGLESLPEELRYLEWENYPLKCLPSKFCPENLVELHMPRSQLEQLWNEDQFAENLKVIELANSVDLIRIPHLSKSPKLEVLIFGGCTKLVEIPSSIGCLSKLLILDLESCISLNSIPDTICNLKSLTELNVSGCKNLNRLPENLGNLESLKRLDAAESGITKLPSSINQLRKLELLDCSKCINLVKIPSTSLNGCLPQLHALKLKSCKNLKSIPSGIGLTSLQSLRLDYCKIFEFPNSIGSLSSRDRLRFRRNGFKSIHESTKQLPKLWSPDLRDCKRPKVLPESSLSSLHYYLCASNCTSLASAPILFLLQVKNGPRGSVRYLQFENCINLYEVSCKNIMECALAAQLQSMVNNCRVSLRIAGSKVPRGMRYRNSNGSSLSFSLDGPHDLMGFSFCAVLDPKIHPFPKFATIYCEALFTGESTRNSCEAFLESFYGSESQSENVLLWSTPITKRDILDSIDRICKASFQFFVQYYDGGKQEISEELIVECGVHPIFKHKRKPRGKTKDEEKKPATS
ncbi:disease resistance protein RPV1 isoform X2 [Hevea brasiliensis]|uniref:disease resistance protein RPV1 isoform X2 n=1 Tax=Hevea brasiliensis TaxID=3981 RepID=UPI0025ED7867|nr:disease resistance protein RPV1 isoform X2 [Hevea brasiliensis]